MFKYFLIDRLVTIHAIHFLKRIGLACKFGAFHIFPKGLPKTVFFYHGPKNVRLTKKNIQIRNECYCIHYNFYLKHFLIRAIIKRKVEIPLVPLNAC